ncbi:MAG: chorismate mutase [Terriglobia bacterium]
MDVDDWRKQIDTLDEQLVELLNRRSRCAAEIGKLKHRAGEPVYSPAREREILERVQKMNGGPLGNDALKRLFERIIDEARTVEQRAYEEKDS